MEGRGIQPLTPEYSLVLLISSFTHISCLFRTITVPTQLEVDDKGFINGIDACVYIVPF